MNHKTMLLRTAALSVLLGGAFAAHAATVWNEAGPEGDFSDDGLATTQIEIGLGDNLVFGTTGNDGSGVDRDYFQFTVPVGALLTAVMVLPETVVSGGSSFIAFQAGPQITVLPNGQGAENLLGYTHYGNDLVGTDILQAAIFGPVQTLGAGTYAVWVQETGGPASYGFNFQVTAVPEPGTALLAAMGLLALSRCRHRDVTARS